MPTKGGAAGGKGDMGYCQLGEIRGLNRGDIGGRLMESWGGLLSTGTGGGMEGIWYDAGMSAVRDDPVMPRITFLAL